MTVDPNCATTATVTSNAVATTVSAATTAAAAVTSTADTAAAVVSPSRPSTGLLPPSSRSISPLPQPPTPPPPPPPHPHQLHNTLHFPSQSLYTAQPLPIRTPNPHPNSQLSKPHDLPGHGVLYPVASSGRGFIPRGIRSLSTDQMVTVANHGGSGYPPPSLVFPHGVRAMGSPHLDYLNHPLLTRPPNLQYSHLGSAVNDVSISSHSKAAPRATISDSNGSKDARERSRDDTFIIIKDRKVRITEDASLYALCRSWLRNGTCEEWQLQQKDVMKALPKPLPASMVASYMSNKKEDEDEEEQEEDEKSVENLTPRDILQRHIKRCKKVRARLREERLQRITRYRSRLRLLLPPPVEQFRNDTAAGN